MMRNRFMDFKSYLISFPSIGTPPGIKCQRIFAVPSECHLQKHSGPDVRSAEKARGPGHFRYHGSDAWTKEWSRLRCSCSESYEGYNLWLPDPRLRWVRP